MYYESTCFIRYTIVRKLAVTPMSHYTIVSHDEVIYPYVWSAGSYNWEVTASLSQSSESDIALIVAVYESLLQQQLILLPTTRAYPSPAHIHSVTVGSDLTFIYSIATLTIINITAYIHASRTFR